MMTINQETVCTNKLKIEKLPRHRGTETEKKESQNTFSKPRCLGVSVVKNFMTALSLLIVFTLCVIQASAQEWAQFRGPNGTGISATKNLPVEFNPQKNVLWKTPLPQGHSSPVLGTDKIFVTGFEGNRLFTIALDRATGKE